MRISKNSKRILIFIALSIISISLILYFTITEETFDALAGLNPLSLVISLFLWLAALTLDSGGFLFFVKGTGERLSMWNGYKLTVIRIFFNLLTPFTFGGQPLIVYILSKFKIPIGKGTSIVLTRLLSLSVFSTLGGIFSLIFFGDLVSSNRILKIGFLTTGIVAFIAYGGVVFCLLVPSFMKKVIQFISFILHKSKILRNKHKFFEEIIGEIYLARSSFTEFFKKHIMSLLGAFLLAGALYVTQILILLNILNGLGITVSLMEGFALCSLLIFLIAFIPTPGASGLGEVLFIIIFAGSVPKYLLGVAVLLWRFFYQYLSAILGAVFTATFFSGLITKTPQELSREETKTTD